MPQNFLHSHYPKYLITKERDDYSQSGIKHLNIIEFLMNFE